MCMLNNWQKTLMFLGDLLPIFLIGMLLFINPFPSYPFISFSVLLIISFIGTVYLRYIIRDSTKYNKDVNFPSDDHEIIKVEDRGSIYTIYMVSFVSLIPLFSENIFGLVSFGIVILIIYSLYMNSDMLFYNPILALGGYRFYKFGLSNGDEIYVISKSQIYKREDRKNLTFYGITDYAYFVKKETR